MDHSHGQPTDRMNADARASRRRRRRRRDRGHAAHPAQRVAILAAAQAIIAERGGAFTGVHSLAKIVAARCDGVTLRSAEHHIIACIKAGAIRNAQQTRKGRARLSVGTPAPPSRTHARGQAVRDAIRTVLAERGTVHGMPTLTVHVAATLGAAVSTDSVRRQVLALDANGAVHYARCGRGHHRRGAITLPRPAAPLPATPPIAPTPPAAPATATAPAPTDAVLAQLDERLTTIAARRAALDAEETALRAQRTQVVESMATIDTVRRSLAQPREPMPSAPPAPVSAPTAQGAAPVEEVQRVRDALRVHMIRAKVEGGEPGRQAAYRAIIAQHRLPSRTVQGIWSRSLGRRFGPPFVARVLHASPPEERVTLRNLFATFYGVSSDTIIEWYDRHCAR